MAVSNFSFPADGKPRLIAVVDTEEEFDWAKPFSREATTVQHMQYIGRLQEVFDRFRVCPTYVVDYSIASQADGWRPLRELYERDKALIGTHLHPWVTPPYKEELSAFNSYAGNLASELEFSKIEILTDQIEKSFGHRPTIYKAGRFGIGPNTFRTLSELGYEIDLSPAPPLDCSGDGGPDFSSANSWPFHDPKTGLLVIPMSGAFSGWWPVNRAMTHQWATSSWRSRLHANAIFYRSGAVQRLWLSPESFEAAELIALTRLLLNEGIRLFVLSLHSPIVLAGGTPFAKTQAEVDTILRRLTTYLQFFFEKLEGQPWTPETALEFWPSSDKRTLTASLS